MYKWFFLSKTLGKMELNSLFLLPLPSLINQIPFSAKTLMGGMKWAEGWVVLVTGLKPVTCSKAVCNSHQVMESNPPHTPLHLQNLWNKLSTRCYTSPKSKGQIQSIRYRPWRSTYNSYLVLEKRWGPNPTFTMYQCRLATTAAHN